MEWKQIDEAQKDGRFVDSYNSYNGERRITRWNENWTGLNTKWQGWDGQWGNVPTHFKPMPYPQREE